MSTSIECCNQCQTCIACAATCITCQSFCQTTGQSAADYFTQPWPSITKDDIIIKRLPRNLFNQAFSYVQQAAAKGSKKNSGGWSGAPETRDFLYANKVTELAKGISSLGGGTSVDGATKDAVIYASYMQLLVDALNKLQLHPTACNNCNVGCDVPCLVCNSCVTCNTDNSHWPSNWNGSWSGSWSGNN